MGGTIKLANIHHVAFVFENGSLVVVNVEVVWCRKDRHDRRETSRLGLTIHAVSGSRVGIQFRAKRDAVNRRTQHPEPRAHE